MEIEFSGAAREVTGSCHILRVGGKTVLLDCGLFQGKRSESEAKNRRLPLPVEQLDAVVLSHAHIDHAGRLPFLVSNGYQKTIFATPATRDLSAIMLADSAHIQEKDAEFLARRSKQAASPLYGMRDAVRTIEQMAGMPYNKPFEVVAGVRCTFVDAGHILGSASVVLDCTEGAMTKRLVFSADIGRAGLPILRDPVVPSAAHAVIMESTYGNRDHVSVEGERAKLAEVVRATAARGGRVLVPAFAVGRTQEIIYELHALARAGDIPAIPIYIDSPLAIDATSVFQLHPDLFDRNEALIRQVQDVFKFNLVTYTRDVADSKALNGAQGPMIIIAASGMAESGRIVHHLAHGAPDPRNTILVVGFMAEHTLGRRIVERRPEIKVFGEQVPLRADVKILNGYSAHADRTELTDWVSKVRGSSPELGPVWLVHGEPAAQDPFIERLKSAGFDASAPGAGMKVTF